MDGWASEQQLLLLFALVLLAAWAMGGGFEVKGIKVPQISTTSRFLSAITGGGLLLIWLVIWASSLESGIVPDLDDDTVSAQTEVSTPGPTATPPDTSGTEVRVALERAIETASNRAELAYQTGNLSYLDGYFRDAALDEMIDAVELLEAEGLDREVLRQDSEFENFSVSTDGAVAEVNLIHTFTEQYYSLWFDGCAFYLDVEDVRQKVTLNKKRAGVDEADWVISLIEYDVELDDPFEYITEGCSPLL
jgi:hypothetical protein